MQLAHELGARVIGTGRTRDREAALGLGADAFVDLQAGRLEDECRRFTRSPISAHNPPYYGREGR